MSAKRVMSSPPRHWGSPHVVFEAAAGVTDRGRTRGGTACTCGLGDLVAELADERARLDVLDSGDPYSAVRSVFTWSYRGLDDLSAAAFRALGAHPGHTFDAMRRGADRRNRSAEANAAIKGLADADI